MTLEESVAGRVVGIRAMPLAMVVVVDNRCSYYLSQGPLHGFLALRPLGLDRQFDLSGEPRILLDGY